MNISLIGFGHMAKAIARGLVRDSNYHLRASAPSLPVGINQQGIETHHDNKAILRGAEVIILAVKPAQLAVVLQDIKPVISDHCLIVSLAAGIQLDWILARLKPEIAIIRAMPNIAAAISQSATPLIANHWVTEQQKHVAQLIFETIGQTTWVNHEKDMDAFTALSGSGPAYVFFFMEALIKASTRLGLSEAIATSFTLQTVKGAVELALKHESSLTTLRKTVTSPAGTTAAAIQVLIEHDLDELMFKALKAASERAHELGQLKEL